MTHEQAELLLRKAREMMAIGDEISQLAQAMAKEGSPVAHYQPLVDASSHLIGAMNATHTAWKEARDHAVH